MQPWFPAPSCFQEFVFMTSRIMSKRALVFVYGTLKSGQPNHYLIEGESRGQCKPMGTAVTVERYPLVVAGRYNVPYLLYKPGTGKTVKGEVYEVDEERLEILDGLEHHPIFYERKPVNVKLINEMPTQDVKFESEILFCDAYFLVKFVDHLLKFPMLESYHDEWNGLKYVPPGDRPTAPAGADWWYEVHTEYQKPN